MGWLVLCCRFKLVIDYESFFKSMLEDIHTSYGRLFAFFIQSLILVLLITFSIETLPDNSHDYEVIIKYF